MKRIFIYSVLLFCFILFSISSLKAGIPEIMNYQAYLYNPTTNLALDGSYPMTFAIYAAESGGVALWVETQDVTAKQGYINVYLGTGMPLSLPFDKPYFLEISLGSNVFQRTKLASVPYTFYAKNAYHADTSKIAQSVPDGAITQIKLAPGVTAIPSGPAGGDLEGNYPNPTVKPSALLSIIKPGSITKEMLSTDISYAPVGEARGALTGFYPDPQLSDNAVSTSAIADGSVTDNKLSDNAISSSKIINGAVTYDKIAPGTANGQLLFWNNTNSQWELPPAAIPSNNQVIVWNSGMNSLQWANDGLAVPYAYSGGTVGGAPLISLTKTDNTGNGMAINVTNSDGNALNLQAGTGIALNAVNSYLDNPTLNIQNNGGGPALNAEGSTSTGRYVARIYKLNSIEGSTAYIGGYTMNTDGNEPSYSNTKNAVLVVNNMYQGGLALITYGNIYANGRINCQSLGIGIDNPNYAIELPNNPNFSGQAIANQWLTYSDGRVKSETQPIEYGLSEIMKLQPKEYNHHASAFEAGTLKIDKEKVKTIGLIAQEVKEIIPEAAFAPGNENGALWGVDYQKLIPVLIKAIQEQQLEIEQLKNKLDNIQKTK